MPNYNTQVPPFTLYPGDTGLAFNSENPSPPQASQQFAMGVPYGSVPASISLELSFPGGAPSSFQFNIEESTTDADPNYIQIAGPAQLTQANLNSSGVARLDVVNVKGLFVRVKKISQTGGGACSALLSR
jgi:hypothetical protein